MLNVMNIPHTIVSPTKHCCGSDWYYENFTWTFYILFPYAYMYCSTTMIHSKQPFDLPYLKEMKERKKESWFTNVNVCPLADSCSRVLLIQGQVYCPSCNRWALGMGANRGEGGGVSPMVVVPVFVCYQVFVSVYLGWCTWDTWLLFGVCLAWIIWLMAYVRVEFQVS